MRFSWAMPPNGSKSWSRAVTCHWLMSVQSCTIWTMMPSESRLQSRRTTEVLRDLWRRSVRVELESVSCNHLLQLFDRTIGRHWKSKRLPWRTYLWLNQTQKKKPTTRVLKRLLLAMVQTGKTMTLKMLELLQNLAPSCLMPTTMTLVMTMVTGVMILTTWAMSLVSQKLRRHPLMKWRVSKMFQTTLHFKCQLLADRRLDAGWPTVRMLPITLLPVAPLLPCNC
mmetsp:Transcript_3410/g.5629  ORF Transcript_3410/g.5629 Transcript_3410/m.5629 type:complete len:225 (-) Transcript_3410:893-1567(-)